MHDVRTDVCTAVCMSCSLAINYALLLLYCYAFLGRGHSLLIHATTLNNLLIFLIAWLLGRLMMLAACLVITSSSTNAATI